MSSSASTKPLTESLTVRLAGRKVVQRRVWVHGRSKCEHRKTGSGEDEELHCCGERLGFEEFECWGWLGWLARCWWLLKEQAFQVAFSIAFLTSWPELSA